jgi:hypothetical protein
VERVPAISSPPQRGSSPEDTARAWKHAVRASRNAVQALKNTIREGENVARDTKTPCERARMLFLRVKRVSLAQKPQFSPGAGVLKNNKDEP